MTMNLQHKRDERGGQAGSSADNQAFNTLWENEKAGEWRGRAGAKVYTSAVRQSAARPRLAPVKQGLRH